MATATPVPAFEVEVEVALSGAAEELGVLVEPEFGSAVFGSEPVASVESSLFVGS